MICQSCNFDNAQGDKFCASCGAKLPEETTQAVPPPPPPAPVQTAPQAGYAQPAYAPPPPPVNTKCTFCGEDNAPGSIVCAKCGAKLTAPSIAGESKAIIDDLGKVADKATDVIKKLPLKKILIGAGAAAVLIVALIVGITLLVGPAVSTVKGSIEFFDDSGIVVVSANNVAKFTIDGDYYNKQQSMDGTKAVVMTDYDWSDGGTLWFVTASGAVRVAEDVRDYILSDTGKGVAYLTDYNTGDNTATLYLYDTGSKKSTKITDEAMATSMSVCISPDGKSVGYVSDVDTRYNEFTGYVRINGKNPEKLGDYIAPIAIADGGKLIYYMKQVEYNDASFHVKRGNTENRLISDTSSINNVNAIFNIDYSEVIFNVDGRTFISRNGGERTRVSSSSIRSLVLPDQVQVSYNRFPVYGIKTFAGKVMYNRDDNYEYITGKFETYRVINSSTNVYNVSISNDGKTLLFLTYNGALYSINPTREGADRVEIARRVEKFVATSNGRSIYFVNDDEELMHTNLAGKQTKIGDYAYESSLTLASNGRLFYLYDYNRGSGDLYSTSGTSKGVKVAEDVSRVYSNATSVFYITRDGDLFRSSGNANFSLFIADYY